MKTKIMSGSPRDKTEPTPKRDKGKCNPYFALRSRERQEVSRWSRRWMELEHKKRADYYKEKIDRAMARRREAEKTRAEFSAPKKTFFQRVANVFRRTGR